MSAPTAETLTVEGPVHRIGSHLAVRLPSDVIANCRLRRARVRVGGVEAIGVVRRLNDGGAALLVDADAAEQLGLLEGGTARVDLQLMQARQRTKVPADVRNALAEVNCDPASLGEADLRHLVTMVLEADSLAIRKARVEAFVLSRRSRRA